MIASSELKATRIAPTLDTAAPPQQSVIWCGALDLAWERLGRDVVKGAPRVRGAEELSDALNREYSLEAELPPGCYFAAAGLLEDGIGREIREGLAKAFPSAACPDFAEVDSGAVAYGHIEAEVKFENRFLKDAKPMAFREYSGATVDVASFGISIEHLDAYEELRKQIDVLFVERDERFVDSLKQFAIDPCRTSSPSQIVLARVQRKATLRETVEYVEAKIAGASEESHHEFGPRDVFRVPIVAFDLLHHFKELEGRDRQFLNEGADGSWIQTAAQTTRFLLTPSGVTLEANAQIAAPSIPDEYVFDRPFLIYMKKRGAVRPFFAAWIANAELFTAP